jgi:site-specific DNA-methyltransferase (adenine-specific)
MNKPQINLHLGDCMEAMKSMPDNAYELAIVDPPYGIGISKNPFRGKQDKKGWDNSIPRKEYFNELFRVTKNQIIWGGNYFNLPPSQGFIIWDKMQPFDFSSAMCEYAWISEQRAAKIYRKHVVTTENNKIHPTQKPVKLYRWLLHNYANPGNKILDTHGGSMSIAIACHDMGFDLDLWEIDPEYYAAGCQRYMDYTKQLKLF